MPEMLMTGGESALASTKVVKHRIIADAHNINQVKYRT